MPRIEVVLPEGFPFRTEIGVRATDLDRSGHLSMAALLMLLDEARIKFNKSMGFNEGGLEGEGNVMGMVLVIETARCAAGEFLSIEVAAGEFTKTAFALFYRITNPSTEGEVARGKTAIEFIDHRTGRPTEVPQDFQDRFAGSLIPRDRDGAPRPAREESGPGV